MANVGENLDPGLCPAPIHPSTNLRDFSSSAARTPTGKIERKVSNVSQGSSEGDRSSPRRVSISKASSLTVALSGGNPKSKFGTLKRKNAAIFSSYKDCFVSVDDGDICFQSSEDDVDSREVFSLLAVREVKLLGVSSSQFQLKIAEQTPPPISIGGSTSLLGSWADFAQHARVKHIVLRALSPKEALEWIAVIKHELKNQVLVCKNLFSTLQSEGHQERAEPLFEQIMELLKVIYEGREHFEIANTLRSYSKWLEGQGRIEEASQAKRQAKAIKRRCEEGLDITLTRLGSVDVRKDGASPEVAIRRLSSLSSRFQSAKKT